MGGEAVWTDVTSYATFAPSTDSKYRRTTPPRSPQPSTSYAAAAMLASSPKTQAAPKPKSPTPPPSKAQEQEGTRRERERRQSVPLQHQRPTARRPTREGASAPIASSHRDTATRYISAERPPVAPHRRAPAEPTGPPPTTLQPPANAPIPRIKKKTRKPKRRRRNVEQSTAESAIDSDRDSRFRSRNSEVQF
ncbi:unnamed protein product, partial [Iphiclides podalirius]